MAEPDEPAGTFSDLYDAMQQRPATPVQRPGVQPKKATHTHPKPSAVARPRTEEPPASGTETRLETSPVASPNRGEPVKATKQQSPPPIGRIPIDEQELIAKLRKAARLTGSFSTSLRLTPEEKRRLTDISYTYRRQGKFISENMMNRIAINWLLEDYEQNGETSIIARIVDTLLE